MPHTGWILWKILADKPARELYRAMFTGYYPVVLLPQPALLKEQLTINKYYQWLKMWISESDISVWEKLSWNIITTIALFMPADPNLVCMAHKHKVRIVHSTSFPKANLTNAKIRKEWILNQLKYAQKNNLDGINIDFEDPIDETDNSTRNVDSRSSHIGACRITYDVAWSPDGIDDRFYDYKGIAEASDFIFIMSYDEQSQGFSLPCLAKANSDNRNTLKGVLKYRNLEIPFNKMVLGLPWYGYRYNCIKLYSTQPRRVRMRLNGDYMGLNRKSEKPREGTCGISSPIDINELYIELISHEILNKLAQTIGKILVFINTFLAICGLSLAISSYALKDLILTNFINLLVASEYNFDIMNAQIGLAIISTAYHLISAKLVYDSMSLSTRSTFQCILQCWCFLTFLHLVVFIIVTALVYGLYDQFYASFQNDMLESLRKYEVSNSVKQSIDYIQKNYECCDCTNTNLYEAEENFQNKTVSLFQIGCEHPIFERIDLVFDCFGTYLLAILGFEVLYCVLFRYLQTSIENLRYGTDPTATTRAWLIRCCSCDRNKPLVLPQYRYRLKRSNHRSSSESKISSKRTASKVTDETTFYEENVSKVVWDIRLKILQCAVCLFLCHTVPKLTPDGHTNMEFLISREDGPELGQQPINSRPVWDIRLKILQCAVCLFLCHTVPKLTPDGHTNMEF
ncbi:Di-N-acetylchitobiase [Nymphon striatum]|nr:Di-N-acetylchitobiase [Nymphon striatum]